MSDGPASPATRLEETERYLQTLTEDAPTGSFLDVRYRTEDGFGRFFKDTDDPTTARAIAQIGEETDVYVGVAPRERHSGRREDVASTQLLWADCDTPESVQALDEFPLTPTMTVRSGSGEPEHENTHAYWALTEPLSTEELEDTNRRLADALGADRKCADAARILRPAGTNNFKHDPPHPVKLAEHTDNHYDPQEIFDALPPRSTTPEPPTQTPKPAPPAREPQHSNHTTRGNDPLHSITPKDYVRQLTGQEPGADGKAYCPFHPDDDPSLHVYPTPEQGWACYGCPTPDGKTVGGDIYNFASKLWDIPTRGQDFLQLRDRLDDTFDIER